MGVLLPLVDAKPWPNWPYELFPRHQSSADSVIAQLCNEPTSSSRIASGQTRVCPGLSVLDVTQDTVAGAESVQKRPGPKIHVVGLKEVYVVRLDPA